MPLNLHSVFCYPFLLNLLVLAPRINMDTHMPVHTVIWKVGSFVMAVLHCSNKLSADRTWLLQSQRLLLH